MKVYKVMAGKLLSNNYVVTQDEKTCIIIDLGGDEALRLANSLGLKVEYVLLTHGHADHIFGCASAQAMGVKIGIAKNEVELAQGIKNLGMAIGMPVKKFDIDFTFEDGDILDLCGLKIKVIATAGHTEGSVTFMIEDTLFTGDTMFKNSYGRTDFPSGNESKMKQSLEKLCSLVGDYKVCTGHDEETSLDYERDNYKF